VTSSVITLKPASVPVRAGLVPSLAHPAGNVTGMSIRQPDPVGKRLELWALGLTNRQWCARADEVIE